jgi:hypothetical protein
MMKKVFNFYFSTVAIVSAIIVLGGIFILIGNKSISILNYILDFTALIGVLIILFVIIKRLFQYYYLKTMVLRRSYNWRNLLSNCTIGIFFIFSSSQLDLHWIGIPANVALGVMLIFTGFIGFPKFLRIGKDSIIIDELAMREIKFIDLLRFDYKDNRIAFETMELNYELKVFRIDANQINKIQNIVKESFIHV